MKRALLASVLCLLSIAGWAKEPATLGDLELLVQKGAHAEVLERAEDVAPSARTAAWKAAVTTSAVALVKSAAVTKDPFAQALGAEALAKRHTFLGEREAFQRARDAAVVAGAQRCFKAGDDASCWTTLEAFEPTLTPAGSMELASVLRKNGAMPNRVAVLYARAAAKDPAACKDGDVQDVLVSALDSPVDGAAATAARSVAFTSCWAALLPKLKAAMVGASAYRLQNGCKPMREKKALTELQEDLCKDEGQ